jgi:hypothetical protein
LQEKIKGRERGGDTAGGEEDSEQSHGWCCSLLAGIEAPCVIISTGRDPACKRMRFLLWVFVLIRGEKVGVDKKFR